MACTAVAPVPMMPTRLSLRLARFPGVVASRVAVVPAAGVEGVALEVVDARDARELGPVERAGGHGDILRTEFVAAVGGDDPAFGAARPSGARVISVWNSASSIKVVVAGDALGVFEDLGGEGVFVLRHVAELFEQRQVDVGFDVAHRAGIAVPVPGAADIAGLVDEADALEPGLAQARAHEQAAEAAADDEEVDFVEHRLARDRLGPGIVDIAGEVALHLDILRVAVLAQALVALGEVFRVQRLGIEIDPADDGREFGMEVHGAECTDAGGTDKPEFAGKPARLPALTSRRPPWAGIRSSSGGPSGPCPPHRGG